MIGISLKGVIGIGDAIQFTSVPENYWHHTGEKLIDVDEHWVFDGNPYIVRKEDPEQIVNLWEGRARTQKPRWDSLAERNAAMIGCPVTLTRPRLYWGEELQTSNMILVHNFGTNVKYNPHESRPRILSRPILDHIKNKYPNLDIFQIGLPGDPETGFPRLITSSMWDLARTIAACKVFIGVDSGPSWIAACYPKVIAKKVLMQYDPDYLKTIYPLTVSQPETHWHDPAFEFYSRDDEDAGFAKAWSSI